jgi:hypothetical protein
MEGNKNKGKEYACVVAFDLVCGFKDNGVKNNGVKNNGVKNNGRMKQRSSSS